MSRLPGSIHQPLLVISSGKKPGEILAAVKTLLAAERSVGDLARSFEAFREMTRALGVLEESRNGQRVYDAWSKVERFLSGSRRSADGLFSADPGESREPPPGYEALGARWDRTGPEIKAFIEEERSIERTMAEAPVSTHVGFGLRSRLLLLDRRAERIKVCCDLIQRDLSEAASAGLDRLGGALSAPRRDAAQPAPGPRVGGGPE